MSKEEKENDPAVTLNGGKEIDVTINGESRRVLVKQLWIGELPKLAQLLSDNGGFGDEEAMLALYVGPDILAELKEAGPGSLEAASDIIDKAEEINLPFLEEFLVRQGRRGKMFAKLNEGTPSLSSQPKSAESQV